MLQGLPISGQTTTGNQTGYQAPPNKLSQTAGLIGAVGTGLGIANQAGALNGIKDTIARWPGNYTSTPTQSQTDINNLPNDQTAINNYNSSGDLGGQSNIDTNTMGFGFDSSAGAAGGLPKHFRTKNYAQGGLVALSLYNALRG